MCAGTTINKPCVESVINAVATILHSQMQEVSIITRFIDYNGTLDFFFTLYSKSEAEVA